MPNPTPEEIRDFVIAGHGDADKVKSMLAAQPDLLDLAHPWSETDSETAIQAASHVGNVALAEFLLAQGAPLAIYTAAMLGRRDEVTRLLAADPELAKVRGAHGIPVLPHAAMCGDVALVSELHAAGAVDGASSALIFAVARRHVALVVWLLTNAAPDLTWKNFQGKTAPTAAHTAADTAALLPYPELADALAEVLRLRHAGVAFAPPRLIMPLTEEGLLLVMPATDGVIAITKLATAHTRNAARGLPSIQAEVYVLEAATGRRLFSLDGAVVTARRTAALSLLAARTLAPDPSGALLIVGAGTQGRSHLDAFADGLGTRRVLIASRSRRSAEALAGYAVGRGLDASVAIDFAAAALEASLIVTATTSATPVLPNVVRQDVFIAAVGAFKPTMAEVPPGLARAARVVVDTLEGAQAEAGDLIQAGIDWSTARALEDVLGEPRPARGPILFKSVGNALWDLAAARLAAARLIQ